MREENEKTKLREKLRDLEMQFEDKEDQQLELLKKRK